MTIPPPPSLGEKTWNKYIVNVNVIVFDFHIRSHEYLKHGTCCTGISCLSTEHDYFSTVLDLFAQHLNYGDILDSHGIKPSNTTTYKVVSIAHCMRCPFMTAVCVLAHCSGGAIQQCLYRCSRSTAPSPMLLQQSKCLVSIYTFNLGGTKEDRRLGSFRGSILSKHPVTYFSTIIFLYL